MRSAANLAKHELIGLSVSVRRDGTTEHEGRVIDETMNTFRLLKGDKEITVPKIGREFVFRLDGQDVALDGNGIKFRPEDRTKKVKTRRK